MAASSEISDSVRRAVQRNPNLKVAPPKPACRDADVVFLATPFAATEAALLPVTDELIGKILVDCTNPVGPGVTHGLGSVQSGAEQVQKLVPDARVVKAFGIYGFENLEDSAYPGYNVKPAMLYCGNDAAAKTVVAELIDVGGIDQALHLEHMTLLSVRMVRAKGNSPNLVWAALRRQVRLLRAARARAAVYR